VVVDPALVVVVAPAATEPPDAVVAPPTAVVATAEPRGGRVSAEDEFPEPDEPQPAIDSAPTRTSARATKDTDELLMGRQ
jgi:hypothetical protein